MHGTRFSTPKTSISPRWSVCRSGSGRILFWIPRAPGRCFASRYSCLSPPGRRDAESLVGDSVASAVGYQPVTNCSRAAARSPFTFPSHSKSGKCSGGSGGRTRLRSSLLKGASKRSSQSVRTPSEVPAWLTWAVPRYKTSPLTRTAMWIGNEPSSTPQGAPMSRSVTGAGAGPIKRTSSAFHTPLLAGASLASAMITIPAGPMTTLAPPTVKRPGTTEPPTSTGTYSRSNTSAGITAGT